MVVHVPVVVLITMVDFPAIAKMDHLKSETVIASAPKMDSNSLFQCDILPVTTRGGIRDPSIEALSRRILIGLTKLSVTDAEKTKDLGDKVSNDIEEGAMLNTETTRWS